MLCKELEDGMLLEVSGEHMCGWISEKDMSSRSIDWVDMPPQFKIGSIVVGAIAKSSGACGSYYTKKDTIMYLGKKQVFSVDGEKSRQIRLVYVGGSTGYVEGYDFRHLEQKDTIQDNKEKQ